MAIKICQRVTNVCIIGATNYPLTPEAEALDFS
jgi:hypothetical protein